MPEVTYPAAPKPTDLPLPPLPEHLRSHEEGTVTAAGNLHQLKSSELMKASFFGQFPSLSPLTLLQNTSDENWSRAGTARKSVKDVGVVV